MAETPIAPPRPPEAPTQAALRLLLAQRPYLLAFIVSLVRDFRVAEEIFQEVSVAVCAHERRLPPTPVFGAWVRELARRRALAVLRAKARHGGPVPPPALVDEIERAIAALAEAPTGRWQQRKEVLRAAVAGLPAHLRRVLELRYLEELDPVQIAAQMGRAAGETAADLARARAALEAALGASAPTVEGRPA